MKLKKFIFIALLAAFATEIPPIAPAQAAPLAEAGLAETRTPLIIIRFSQRNVMFERALQNALTQAINAKRDVMFDVTLREANSGGTGGTNMSRVVSAMRDMGVPSARIQPVRGPASGQRYDEIYIYVR